MKLQLAVTSAAVTAALLTPAAADAHKVSSSQSVKVHVRAADRALTRLEASVALGADATAGRALARHRRHMRAAVRETKRLGAGARRSNGARAAAAATVALALEADAGAEVLADVVNEVDGSLKAEVALALERQLLTGAGVLRLLTELVDEVPARAQAAIAQAIGALANGQRVVADIVAAIDPNALTDAVRQSLASALGTALATVDAATETLTRIAGQVAATALPTVTTALNAALAQLDGLGQTLQGVGGLLPGLPALGGGSGSVEVGIDGTNSVSVTGLCGLVGALPFKPLGC